MNPEWALQPCTRARPSDSKEKLTTLPRSLSTRKSKSFSKPWAPLVALPAQAFHLFRRLMILEDQYKNACKELEEKQEQLKSVRPPTAKVRRDVHLIKTLENKLDKSLVKYNEI